MKRVRNCALAAATAVPLIALLLPQAAQAAEPPWPGCRPATKLEYRSAMRQYLLTNRVGAYVRTGHIWHRFYWYCLR